MHIYFLSCNLYGLLTYKFDILESNRLIQNLEKRGPKYLINTEI